MSRRRKRDQAGRSRQSHDLSSTARAVKERESLAAPASFDGSSFNFPRNREPWTPGEERKLLAIYASGGRVWWCGKWRSAPSYRAAKELGRSPTAVQARFDELRRCRARKARAPEPPPLDDGYDNYDEDGSPLDGDNDPDA